MSNACTFCFVLIDAPEDCSRLTDLQIQQVGVHVDRCRGEDGGEVVDEPHGNIRVARLFEVGTEVEIVFESSGRVFGGETLS
jgi:hypothetical protein